MDILLAIVTIAFASLLIILVRGRLRGINPASVFTYFWTVQIIVILIGWSSYMHFQYWGLLFILFGILSFNLGYLAPKSVFMGHDEPDRFNIIYTSSTKKAYFTVLTLSFLGIVYQIYNHGFTIQNFLDLSSFLEMSAKNASDRYSGADEGDIFVRILGVNAYTCPLLGGLCYFFFKKKLWSYLAVLPNIISGFSEGVKMGIISSVFLWIIGYVVSSKLLSRKLRFNVRMAMISFSGLFVFMAMMIVSMMFRYGSFDLDTFADASNKMIAYGLGHIPAFDMWYVKFPEHISELTYGGKTIYGITNALGILPREQGVFTQMYKISVAGDETNVFTVFRFFAEDFGTIGTWIFLFGMGYICRIIYYAFQQKKHIYLSTTLVCIIYFYISWSFATSIFAYSTYIIMFAYLYILLKMVFVKTRTTSI